jgi:hypothetical protein
MRTIFHTFSFHVHCPVKKGETTLDHLEAGQAIAIITFFAVIALCGAALMIIPYWKIYSKTGQAGAMALLQLIPLVNIVMLYVLAFSEWPIEREMRAAKEARNRIGQP